jgi:hypothetical protein
MRKFTTIAFLISHLFTIDAGVWVYHVLPISHFPVHHWLPENGCTENRVDVVAVNGIFRRINFFVTVPIVILSANARAHCLLPTEEGVAF